MSRKAFITGITGQDGSYLAELLLEKGYEVHGMVRRSSSFNTARIDHLCDAHIRLLAALRRSDATARRSIGCCATVRPDEMYNLGAQSHVRVSFDVPEYTADDRCAGHDSASSRRSARADVTCRFYQASSSEMYGQVRESTAADRGHAVLSAQPVRRGKVYALLDHASTTARRTGCSPQRDPLQPRVAAARRDVRDAQDHARAWRAIKRG